MSEVEEESDSVTGGKSVFVRVMGSAGVGVRPLGVTEIDVVSPFDTVAVLEAVFSKLTCCVSLAVDERLTDADSVLDA